MGAFWIAKTCKRSIMCRTCTSGKSRVGDQRHDSADYVLCVVSNNCRKTLAIDLITVRL
jgi:hypothetical protein